MRMNPVFQFETLTDTGIDKVPVNSKILIADSDGSGTPKEVLKTSLGDFTEASTISDFLSDPNSHTDVDVGGVVNDISGTASRASQIWTGTQVEYDTLPSYPISTLYFIK